MRLVLSDLSSAKFVAAGVFAIPLSAQKQIFSTYDWTQATAGSEQQFREVRADVKTPGGFPEFGANADSRRTYAVDAIEVRDIRANLAVFSQFPAQPHDGLGFFLTSATAKRPSATTCDAAILVTRPSSTLSSAIVQLGLPPATPWLTLAGTDFWLAGPSSQNAQLVFFGSPTTLRMPLPPFTGTGILSVQVICLLAGTTTFAPGCTSDFTASPALFFEL